MFCEYGTHLFHLFKEDETFLKRFQSNLPDGEVVLLKEVSAELAILENYDGFYDVEIYLIYITNDSFQECNVEKVAEKKIKAIKKKINKQIVTTEK